MQNLNVVMNATNDHNNIDSGLEFYSLANSQLLSDWSLRRIVQK